MDEFLESTEIVDWQHPDVLALARKLAADDPEETACNCFVWVRDEVQHSWDYQRNPVTCRASDVLRERTGYCYAKSHLLTALLRANGLPAGFSYQRLVDDESSDGFCLHGLTAVHLPRFGWYRIDARGNKPGVSADFRPPEEHLAFLITHEGEVDFGGILQRPLPDVVEALRRYTTWDALAVNLPDLPPDTVLPADLVLNQ